MADLLFSPGMTVVQTLQTDGNLSRVFLDRKTACAGCYLARFCTLEDVAKTYEFSVQDFIGELQDAARAKRPLTRGAENE